MERNGFQFRVATTKSQNRKGSPQVVFLERLPGNHSDKPILGHGYLSFPSIYPKFQSYEVRHERSLGLKMHIRNMFL